MYIYQGPFVFIKQMATLDSWRRVICKVHQYTFMVIGLFLPDQSSLRSIIFVIISIALLFA